MSIKIEISKNVNGVNWRNVMRYLLMIVDDLGTEATRSDGIRECIYSFDRSHYHAL